MPNQPNARKAKSTPAFAKPPTGPPRKPPAARRRRPGGSVASAPGGARGSSSSGGASGSGGSSRAVWLTVAVVAVLAVAAGIIAIVSSGSSTSKASAPPGLEQTQPVTVAGTALPTLPDSGDDPAVGLTAPTLSGLGFDSTAVDVKPGNTATLVVFLAHWCPHCQREMPKLVRWDKDGKLPAGVGVIGIATQTSASEPNYPPSVWLTKAGFPWPVMADSPTGDAAAALGITSWPGFVLLAKDGTVLWRATGEIDVDDLAAKITAALTAAGSTTSAAPSATTATSSAATTGSAGTASTASQTSP